jgi:flagellar protein FliO/FliZ
MKRSPFLCLAAAIGPCVLTPATALAAQGESTPLNLGGAANAGHQVAPGSAGGGLVRTIVGLAIVLAVIYGLYWVLKQVKASKEERSSGFGLSTIATLPLGPSRSMQLIRAGSEVVLIGVGEGGVTPIRVYSETEARASGLLDEEDVIDGGPGGVRLPALMNAGPETLPSKVGQALRRGTVRKLVDDMRMRTVIK